MLRRSVLLAAVSLLALAGPAAAEDRVATAGPVSATLSSTTTGDGGFTGLHLRITRAGALLYDAPVTAEGCGEPTCRPVDVQARDLDGDGEPELVVTLYWGGAHCCTIGLIFSFDGSGYRRFEHNFGDPGFRLTDLGRDGKAEFLTGDPRFAYRFTAYASSVFPVQVLAWRDGKLADTTSAYEARVRSDLNRSWRLFQKAAREDYEPRGPIAAWAADRYRLGMRAATLKTLRRLAREGRLEGMPPRSARKFVTTLDGFLRRLDYA